MSNRLTDDECRYLQDLADNWRRIRSEQFAAEIKGIDSLCTAGGKYLAEEAAELRHQTVLRRRLALKEDPLSPAPSLQTMDYRSFLETEYWQTLRTLILSRRGRICERCGSHNGPIDLHHKTYEHRGLEIYYQNDIEVLCRDCHKKHHGIVSAKEDYRAKRS